MSTSYVATWKDVAAPRLVFPWRKLSPTFIAVGAAIVLGAGLVAAPETTTTRSAAAGTVAAASAPSPHWSQSVHKSTAASGLAGLLSLPILGQVKINADLGADNAPYNVNARASGFTAHSPTYGFDADLDATGLTLRTGRTSLGLSLKGVGRSADLAAPSVAKPAAVASNAVVYRRGTLTETYRNGPLGIAQSFDLATPPPGQAAGNLMLALQVERGTVTAAAAGDRAMLEASDGTVFGYRGLTARDAAGATLPARLDATGSSLFIHVDDTKARYPITIDPFVHSANTTATSSADFGASVAARRTAAGDDGPGTWVIVGDPIYNGDDGRAYLYFIPDGTTAFQLVSTYASPQMNSKYGMSVDVGTRKYTSFGHIISSFNAIVGAPDYDATYPSQGAVFVHASPHAGCAQATATLLVNFGEAGDQLGSAVATDSTGLQIFGGMPQDNYGAMSDAGSVQVFDEYNCWPTDTLWQSIGLVNSSPAPNDRLGTSVATDRNGDHVVAGAPGDDGHGTAQVFQRAFDYDLYYGFCMPVEWAHSSSQPSWHLDISNATGSDELGRDVAISDTGSTIVVGAPNSWGSFGAAYLYQSAAYDASCGIQDWSGNGTSTAAAMLRELSQHAAAADRTGESVAVSDDGAQVFVGAPYSEDSAGGTYANEGQAFLFEKGSGWSGSMYPTQKIYAGSSTESADDHFGRDVDAVHTAGVKDPLIAGRPDIAFSGNYVERHVFQ